MFFNKRQKGVDQPANLFEYLIIRTKTTENEIPMIRLCQKNFDKIFFYMILSLEIIFACFCPNN